MSSTGTGAKTAEDTPGMDLKDKMSGNAPNTTNNDVEASLLLPTVGAPLTSDPLPNAPHGTTHTARPLALHGPVPTVTSTAPHPPSKYPPK